jgi:putative SOS response-associated peptidase YedK
VPVDAFYEWKKIGAGKQPYAIVGADGLPLALAGLWERWEDRAGGEAAQTFTILTTTPNELCAPIHDRMPVILPREKWAAWLGEGGAAADELRWIILRPYPAELICHQQRLVAQSWRDAGCAIIAGPYGGISWGRSARHQFPF